FLLCVTRLRAVTLTRNVPLSKAQSPGISVSKGRTSGVLLSRFWSSSRSLGRCLLDQRSRMNLFSHLIRSLLHQGHRNQHAEFARRCHGLPCDSCTRLRLPRNPRFWGRTNYHTISDSLDNRRLEATPDHQSLDYR